MQLCIFLQADQTLFYILNGSIPKPFNCLFEKFSGEIKLLR